MLMKSSVKWKLHPLEMVINGGNQWNIVWGETLLLLRQEDESLAAAASLWSRGFSSLPKPREDLCCVRVEAAGCRSGVAPTFLVATLSPMPLTSLGAVMQRLGRFGLMEDEGFARVDLWGEMDKGSEGLE